MFSSHALKIKNRIIKTCHTAIQSFSNFSDKISENSWFFSWFSVKGRLQKKPTNLNIGINIVASARIKPQCVLQTVALPLCFCFLHCSIISNIVWYLDNCVSLCDILSHTNVILMLYSDLDYHYILHKKKNISTNKVNCVATH